MTTAEPSTAQVTESGTTGQVLDTSKPESPPDLRDPFTQGAPTDDDALRDTTGTSPPGGLSPPSNQDRRMSKEWDAAKVPPSRFQKREGSIYATASSRDGHLNRKDRDVDYHAKLKEKGWD